MPAPAIRITAVPRHDHPNSGLQAITFAARFGDEVWALPATGRYIGSHVDVRFFALDTPSIKRLVPIRLIRAAFFLWLCIAAALRPGRLYFVHSFVFAAPLYYLRRRYCLFFHGSDHRFLRTRWGQKIAGAAAASYGIGFAFQSDLATVEEAPNVFIPVPANFEVSNANDVVFVLRNAAVKNPYYPIELAERLGARMGLRIAVLGVSEDELPEPFAQRLRKCQQDGVAIRYLGRQAYEDVVQSMQASHTLMIPSHSEGIPKVALEAMAQGLRVLANARLSLPSEIGARMHHVELEDWDGIARIIEAERSAGPSPSNVEFARQYLLASQSDLAARYEKLYKNHPAGVSGAA